MYLSIYLFLYLHIYIRPEAVCGWLPVSRDETTAAFPMFVIQLRLSLQTLDVAICLPFLLEKGPGWSESSEKSGQK